MYTEGSYLLEAIKGTSWNASIWLVYTDVLWLSEQTKVLYTRLNAVLNHSVLICKMSTPIAIHDPLAINLRLQTKRLLAEIPPNTVHYEVLDNAPTTQLLLATLSNHLALPQFTQLVATLFRPILLDLCVRWIRNENNIEDALIALSYLLEVHEELFPCVIFLSHSEG